MKNCKEYIGSLFFMLCCCYQEATDTFVENIKTEFGKKVYEHLQNSTLMHNACSCNLSQVVPNTTAGDKDKNFQWHQCGSSLPGLRTLDPPFSPPCILLTQCFKTI